MTDFDTVLQRVHEEMARPLFYNPGSPEQMMEERIARIADEMIDISILAMQPDQRPLVGQQWRAIAQILLRAQLIMSVLDDKDVEPIRRIIAALTDTTKPHLTVVSNNG